MKYFGQYLVSKGIITEDALLDALIEQVSMLPPLVQLVRRKGLLNTSQLMEIFALQTERRIEFRQACQELNQWSPDIETVVKTEIDIIRIPLGQILIKKGLVDLQSMTKALDEFLSRIESIPEPATKATPKQNPPVQSNKLDPLLLDEFVSHLSEARLSNLNVLFVTIRAGGGDSDMVAPVLKELSVEFRTLAGLLKFARMERSEALVSAMEILISAALVQVGKKDFHLISLLVENGQNLVGLLGSLKKTLVETQSETAWFEHGDYSSKISELIGTLVGISQNEKLSA